MGRVAVPSRTLTVALAYPPLNMTTDGDHAGVTHATVTREHPVSLNHGVLLRSTRPMLIAAQHLVDRLRQPRSRADEILGLRRRLVAQPAPSQASDEELALARELRRLREELTEAVGEVSACSGCARGRSLPHGLWNGGHCCAGRTEDIFTDDELGALRLSGTTPARLVPPRSDHAGCAFRGPEGCSLDVADRPNLCVRYICRELEAELAEGDAVVGAKRLARDLGETFTRFSRARAERTRDSPLECLPTSLPSKPA